MNYLRPYPLEHAENSYLNGVGKNVNNLHPKAGKGIKITSHNNAHLIEATQTYDANKMRFKGAYDIDAEYFVNDVVVVPTSISGSTSGTYVCVNYVPPQIMDSTLLVGTVAAQIASWGGEINEDYANGYRRDNNVYYPTTKTFTPITGVVESTWTVTASQSFWQILGGSSGVNWRGTYDESSSYEVNDWIFVDPYKTPAYSIPLVSTSGSQAPLSAGEFICVVPVPAYTSGSNGGHNTGSYWYPIYPLPLSSSQVVISSSVYNQVHWGPISPMFNASFCSNGQTVDVFVNGIKSGSIFNYKPAYP